MVLGVIVPIYNMEKYLSQCIRSIIDQTYSELEIILVNDGSTDNSLEICKYYQKKDKRIHVVSKKNGGLVSARKAGLESSTAPYITFVDPDDWLSLNTYTVMVNELTNSRADILTCGYINEATDMSVRIEDSIEEGVYDNSKLLNSFYPRMLYNEITADAGIKPNVWSKIFKRDILMQVLLSIDETITLGEDMACTYLALLAAKRVCVTQNCLYHYRKRDDSMSAMMEEDYFRNIGILYQYLSREFKKSSYEQIMLTQLNNYMDKLVERGKHYLLKKTYFSRYLFPFGQVSNDDRVVLYGAGQVGKSFYLQIKKEKYGKLVLWVDKNSGENFEGFSIREPSEICKTEFDKIVIAIADNTKVEEVRQRLSELGIGEDKIVWKNYFI